MPSPTHLLSEVIFKSRSSGFWRRSVLW